MAKKDKNPADLEKESIMSGVSKKFKQHPGLYIGSVVILVLVVVTFIGGDILTGGGFGSGGGDYTFGYYDKTPIAWVQGNLFSQYVQRALDYYRSQGLDSGDFRFEAQIWRQAYEAAVVHTAVIKIMKKSKYFIPQHTVDRNVAQHPRFLDGKGVFSQALYRQMPDASKRAIWRQTQEELIKSAYYNDLFNTVIPSSEADFIAGMAANTRSFDMVAIKVDDYPADQFLSFANENAELFNSIHLSRISINSEREARRVLDSVKNGNILFEDAARAQSQDNYADRGGDMGIRYFYELESEIPDLSSRQAVFSLGPGSLSDIISNDGEWSFYRIEEGFTEANFEDDAVMERVRSYVRSYRRGLMEDWALVRAEDFIQEAKTSGFDNAARLLLLEKKSFGPLPINYGGLDIFTSLESFSVEGLSQQELGNISHNENFWKLAFSTELNTPTEPLVQGNNVLVFLPVEQTEANEDSISNIASMYSSYWMNSITEQSLQLYFLNHAKMEDNFWNVYYRVFSP